MRYIEVGNPFKLPFVDKEKFKELASVMAYTKDGFVIDRSNWESAYKIMSKYFSGFDFVFECCGTRFTRDDYEAHELSHSSNLFYKPDEPSKPDGFYKTHCFSCGGELEFTHIVYTPMPVFNWGTNHYHASIYRCKKCGEEIHKQFEMFPMVVLESEVKV